MKFLIFFSFLLLTSCSQWDTIKKKPMDLEVVLAFKSEGYAPRTVKLHQGYAQVLLELGDELGEIRLDENAHYRVHQETQTSLSLMDEGPHIDLVNGQHGTVERPLRTRMKNVFLFNPNYKSIPFPKLSAQEISEAVSQVKGVDQRWVKLALTCKDPHSYPCGVGPSRYRFTIEKRIGKEWFVVGTLDVIPPMGC